jgi:hypothetical protein
VAWRRSERDPDPTGADRVSRCLRDAPHEASGSMSI